MRRFVVAFAAIGGLGIAYVLAHWALIEAGREVIVLRTEEAEGTWLESRLWIVDDGAISWLHGADSRWMRNRWVRFVGPDNESTTPVRLEMVSAP